ncbi:OLC1v1017756C2 [Oldenlandia corymbosa var. corymbosa]|nr:OLC1v1017756C2 [Oldenlandia corymbosa var. corymbosa]
MTAISFLAAVENSYDLIAIACSKTPYYQLCESTLRNDPKSWDANLNGLTLIMLNSLSFRSNRTLDAINQFLKEKPELKVPLTNCLNLYSSVVNFFIVDAIKAANRSDIPLGQEYMYDSKKSIHDCENGFKPNPSPLGVANGINSDICDIAYNMFGLMNTTLIHS